MPQGLSFAHGFHSVNVITSPFCLGAYIGDRAIQLAGVVDPGLDALGEGLSCISVAPAGKQSRRSSKERSPGSTVAGQGVK